MIHTFKIYCIISAELAHQILHYLGIRQNRRLFRGRVNIAGLSNVSIAPRGSEHSGYRLAVQVNPAKLLYGYDAYETVVEAELDNISHSFAAAIVAAFNCNTLPSLPDWFVHRIDYAVDIHTEFVDNYLQLFDKADKPRWYKEAYSSKQGSCYLECKAANVNVYKKAPQLKKLGYSQEVIDNAQKILRFEIQCKSPKVGRLRDRYELDGRQLRDFFSRQLATIVLFSYCRRVFKTGDYYSFREASKRIESMVKPRSQTALEKILRAIAQTRSISVARIQLPILGVVIKNTIPGTCVKLCKDQFCRNLKQLSDLNINPVTIPRDWGIDQLQSIMHLIDNRLTPQCDCSEEQNA